MDLPGNVIYPCGTVQWYSELRHQALAMQSFFSMQEIGDR